MKSLSILLVCAATGVAAQSLAAPDESPASGAPAWSVQEMARDIDAARAARQRGDLMSAERLCHGAFERVDRGVLEGYAQYAALLENEHAPDAATLRAHEQRLRQLDGERRRATGPTNSYLGFSPAAELRAYAAQLEAHQQPEAAQRLRALALTYDQVQIAHIQRTRLWQGGQDPRGMC